MRTSPRRRRSLREPSGRCRALCERVEPRLLLACDITLVDGTLQIIGDGTSNTVFVAESRSGVAVICDGEAFSFEGVRALRIDTGDGDDSVTVRGRPDIAIEELVIQTEGGDDRVDVVFAAVEGEAEPLRSLRVRVDAGVGADRVGIRYDDQRHAQDLDVVLSVDPGGVGPAAQVLPDVADEVLVAFSHGSLNSRLFVGNLSWHSTDPPETRIPDRRPSATLTADTSGDRNFDPLFAFTVIGSDGQDDVSADSLLLPVARMVSTASYHVDLGEGDNQATVRFGDGQQGSTPPAGERNIEAAYRGGAGQDTVEISAAMSDRITVGVDVDTGGGDDELTSMIERYGYEGTPVSSYTFKQAWPSKYSGVTRTGGGDDLVQIDVSGFETVENDITAGEGNNQVLVGLLVPAVQKVREAAARTDVLLGGGDDRVEIDVDGFDNVAGRVDAGGGNDTVSIGAARTLRAGAAMTESFQVDLGPGDDAGTFHGRHDRLANSSHVWRGGAGNDAIELDFNVRPLGASATGHAPPAARVELDGGAGGDLLVARWQDALAPTDPRQLDLVLRPGVEDGSNLSRGNQCLVFFLGGIPGDPNQPIIIGSVWNGGDTPADLPPASLHLAVATGPQTLSVRYDLVGTPGADAVDVSVGVPAAHRGRSSVAFNIGTGDGDDAVRAHYDADGDYVLTGVQHAAKGVEASVDLGAGDDRFDFLSEGADESNVRVLAGDGNDVITVKSSIATRSQHGWPSKWYVPTTKGSAAIHLGGGNNRVQVEVSGYEGVDNTITAGDGSNEVVAGLLLPAVQKVREAAASTHAELGDGDNRVSVEVAGYDRAAADLTAGDGDNEILVGLLLPAVQKVREAAARVEVDLGGGENNLMVRVTGGARSLIGKPKEIVVVGTKIRGGAVSADLATVSVGTETLGLLDTLVSGLTVAGSMLMEVGSGLATGPVRAEARMTGVTVLPGATLSYAAAGGSSADVLTVGVDNPTIGPGGTVAVSLLDGGGDDDLAALVRGAGGGGALDVVADGGDGNDHVAVVVELPPDPLRAALERLSVLVLGGAGDDLLYLAVLPDDVRRGYVVAKLDGGAGFDTCSATRDVEVANCEDHVVLSGGGGQ